MKSRALLLPLILLLVPCALAQYGANPQNIGNVHVRVTFDDGRAYTGQALVELMESASTTPVAQGYTNSSGMVDFSNIAVGNYHMVISGEGIEPVDTGMFEVDSRKVSQSQYVTVRRTAEANGPDSNQHGGPTVSAADLNIPQSAQSEFAKANELMANQNWKTAIERLTKALDIYPKFAAAYNNLGVVYSHLKDRVLERQALQKAISVNDHFAPAYVNLARMDIVDRNFPEAETMLTKATSSDPNNAQTLVLLANVQLLDKHYDDAIANCRKAHSMPQDPHALVHYIAARALEHENRPTEALTELQTFLQEEPTGPRAEAVRKEIAGLQNPPR
jgi:tetratricopeptide (TPR) repeat protein